MLNILGENYYIDLEEVTNSCRTGQVIGDESENESETYEINIFKYEVLKVCIERVLNEYDPPDQTLGTFTSEEKLNVSFKFAFNTLLMNNIIKSVDTDE